MSDGRREVEYFHNLAQENEKIPTIDDIKKTHDFFGDSGVYRANAVGVLLAEIDRLTDEIETHAPHGRNYINEQYVDLLLKYESSQQKLKSMYIELKRISEMENLYHIRGIVKDIIWELEGERLDE